MPFAIASLKISRFFPAISWPSPMMPRYHETGKVAVVTHLLGDDICGAGRREFAVAVDPCETGVGMELPFEQREVVVHHHDVCAGVSPCPTRYRRGG